MAGSPIVVPFDFNPVSTESGDTSVDAGKYDLVTVNLTRGTFSIDGNVALTVEDGFFNAVATPTLGSFPGTVIFTCPDDRACHARVYTFGTNINEVFLVHQGVNDADSREDLESTTFPYSGEVTLADGDQITARTSGTGSLVYVSGYFTDGKSTPLVAQYFVPTGTTLALSGEGDWQAARYNVKT